jgi:gamma-glutamyl-gamma-aminobutyrate hydrolase PuuD
MANIGDVIKEMLQLHPEVSLKIGQKSNMLVAEVRIANNKPATIMGTDLAFVVNSAHGEAVRNVADRILSESRLSDAVFDNAVTKEEGDPCCCCSGCSPYADDDEDDEDLNYNEEDF